MSQQLIDTTTAQQVVQRFRQARPELIVTVETEYGHRCHHCLQAPGIDQHNQCERLASSMATQLANDSQLCTPPPGKILIDTFGSEQVTVPSNEMQCAGGIGASNQPTHTLQATQEDALTDWARQLVGDLVTVTHSS